MTRSVVAFGRLFWRPLSLTWIYLAGLAASWPMIMFAGRFDAGLDARSAAGMTLILWTESVALMAALAVIFGFVSREGHGPTFAFTVPALRTRVLRGKLIAGSGVAVLLALGLIYAGDSREAAGIFCCAMFYFSLGAITTDSATPRSAVVIGAIVIATSALRPEVVRGVFDQSPLVAASACLLASAAMLRFEWSTRAARLRAVYRPAPTGYSLGLWFRRAYSANAEVETSDWRLRSVTGKFWDWFGAADYEMFGSRRHGYAGAILWVVVVYCGMSYGLGNPEFAAMMGLIYLATQGHRLLGKWVYPISRPTRGNLQFVFCLSDNVVYFLLASVATGLLNAVHPPHFAFLTGSAHGTGGVSVFAIAFIWAPIAQWKPAVTPGLLKGYGKSGAGALRIFLRVLAAFLLTIPTVSALTAIVRATSVAIAVTAWIALAVIVQGAFWFALRWHFSTNDLV